MTPLRYVLAETDDDLSIEIRGPDGLRLAARDITAGDTGLAFTFLEPEADTHSGVISASGSRVRSGDAAPTRRGSR